MNVEWDNADGIRTLKEKVESVNFPVGEDEEYKDDSNEILKSIGIEEEEESDSDSKHVNQNFFCVPVFDI